ncbi:uncharacterized protein LOC129963852 [Argiope bruennichi]|uniref:MADF domain-containing protein n=1 Tax=Argiope bruennichi TaxID=94029 RepID=A0A8T0E548_ARGBR|nr:uncharacterized protein LOC129963852 [Argiope bruennichi]KAF8764570.1 hypothetical protein HNY73_022633 [Argiope bruennichi]
MPSFRSKLINEIKKHPCLFIEDNPAFKDTVRKNEAWKIISRNLDFEVNFLQNIWKILRDLYQLSLCDRSISNDSKSRPNLLKTFEEEMKFMEYYLQPKKSSPPMTHSLPVQNTIEQIEIEIEIEIEFELNRANGILIVGNNIF